MNSIRARLAILFSTIITCLLLVVFGYLYYFLQRHFNDAATLIIDERILMMTDILTDKKEGLDVLKFRIEKEWINPKVEPLWVQITSPEGAVVAESPLFATSTSSDFIRAERIITLNNSTHLKQTKGIIQHPHYLNVSIRLDQSKEKDLLISYGKKMLLLLFITITFSIYITSRVISRELHPLLKMSRKMKHISLRSLHRRINPQQFPVELAPVAQSFNNMLNKLGQSFEQISRFSADMAHEVRTPLNALMIKIEVMMEKPRSINEYQELLESLYRDTRGLSKLVDTLLFLARAENKNLRLDFEELNLTKEIKSLIEFYEALATEKNINIVFEPQSEVYLKVEKSLFDRALGNLIQNAIQYCHAGATIRITIAGGTDETLIEVSDTGPGIASEHLPHLFERLYRIDASRNPYSGGLGLGLSIVSTIMKLHGGSASVESQMGKGSKFRLHFVSSKKPTAKVEIQRT